MEIKRDPCRDYKSFADVMQRYNFHVNKDFVRRCVVDRFELSLKDAQSKHVLKFSIGNAIYTANFLLWLTEHPDWRTLKYADEASFESRGGCGPCRAL
jgi:hypothetical protein